MLRASLAVMFGLLGVAACAATAESGASSASAATTTGPAPIVDLVCSAAGFSFELTPSDEDPGYDGNLTIEAGTSQFMCNDAAADAGNARVTCTEWPQKIHSGSWTFTLNADNTAVLGTDGAPVAMTCAEKSAGIDAGPMPTYAEEAPVIAAHCSQCHDGDFDTLAGVKAEKGAMYSKIVAGVMPLQDPDFRNSVDGVRLLDFLQNSPELQ